MGVGVVSWYYCQSGQAIKSEGRGQRAMGRSASAMENKERSLDRNHGDGTAPLASQRMGDDGAEMGEKWMHSLLD